MGSGFREGTSSRYLDLTRKREREREHKGTVLWYILRGALKDSIFYQGSPGSKQWNLLSWLKNKNKNKTKPKKNPTKLQSHMLLMFSVFCFFFKGSVKCSHVERKMFTVIPGSILGSVLGFPYGSGKSELHLKNEVGWGLRLSEPPVLTLWPPGSYPTWMRQKGTLQWSNK